MPERPGLEVFYIVESSMHAGVYMVDANTGEIIWKLNRAGHNDQNMILFSADGQVLLEPFPFGLTPLEWDGDLTRELLGNNGQTIANFNGKEVLEVQRVQLHPDPWIKSIFLQLRI